MSLKDRLSGWLGKSKQRRNLVLGSIVIGAALLIINFFYIRDVSGYEFLFPILNLVGAGIVIGPTMIIKYNEYKTKQEIEKRFPTFLRDVTEATKAGMTLPQAIKNASKNEYGPLSMHVDKMAKQIDWGVPFEEVLERFTDRVGSEVLDRTISTIKETHRSGGKVSDILEIVGESVLQISRIREERKGHVYSQMLTGYMIYFIFLGVMIGLQTFLLPSLAGQNGTGMEGGGMGMGMDTDGMGAGSEMGDLTEVYGSMFRNLIIIQGIFSGFAIGQMSEGSIMAGFRHVVFLVAIGYTAFFIFA